ncbi:MAG: TIGR03790 family protein [Planctomycetes bacterium]|nr:TIGR03790 family protein [Planctomycetota bacterium]
MMMLIISALAAPAQAATVSPTAARVLIIYNAAWTGDEDGDGVQDSLEVANYYRAKRGVPAGNMLGLNCRSDGYDTASYAAMQSEVIAPIKAKLAGLGATNIDILLMCYRTPLFFRTLSMDNVLMGLNFWSTSSDNVAWYGNPYLEPTPGLGADVGHFDHAGFAFYGTPMYLVGRIDGPTGVIGALNQIDQAIYGDRYVTAQPGYYNGIAYIDSRGDKGGTYTDASLVADPDVQSGNYGGYGPTDVNIAFGERSVTAAGLPLKWERSPGTIGDAGLIYQDGSSAATAPRALLYGGWYNLGNYKPVFEWLPGSVACDLDSSSLTSYLIRNFNSSAWAANAQKAGATCVCGAAGEPYSDGHTRPNILIAYMLKGYSFAEAAAAANPGIGWMSYALGDPLYAPFAAKAAVRDTQAPTFAGGFPVITQPAHLGSTVNILINDTPEPEVAKARVDWGVTAGYGQSFTSTGFFRRHALSFPELPSSTVIHYRVTLTDAAGNANATGDLIFTSPAQSPYGGAPQPIPGTFQAEYFDLGGEGIAYHDREPSNNVSYQFRPDTAVELYGVSEPESAPAFVGVTHVGEWYEYTVNVAATGTYTAEVIYSDYYSSRGWFHLEFDGQNRTGTMTMNPPAANTPGWLTATATGVSLSAGQHIMRLVLDGPEDLGGFDRFRFTWTGGTTIDSTPPVISSVVVGGISTTGATVTWSTNEGSDSQVEFGTTAAYGTITSANAALVTGHSVALSGLVPGTLYHLRVRSRDAAGNLAVGSDVMFTATGTTGGTAPVISRVFATVSGTDVAIGWTTDVAADSQVLYGLTRNYEGPTGVDPNLYTYHQANLRSLASGTWYFVVKSRNQAGALAVSSEGTFVIGGSTPPPTPPTSSGNGPTISAINVMISGTTASIGWSTDVPADSQVLYGQTHSYEGPTGVDPNLYTYHQANLRNLPTGTWYFKVLSRNQAGGLTTSAESSFVIGGTTPPPTTPTSTSSLSLSQISATVSGTTSTVMWNTSAPADSQVLYGLTTAYEGPTGVDPTLGTGHVATLRALAAGTWHYRVRSKDPAGNTATSDDATFVIAAATMAAATVAGSSTVTYDTGTAPISVTYSGSRLDSPAAPEGGQGRCGLGGGLAFLLAAFAHAYARRVGDRRG